MSSLNTISRTVSQIIQSALRKTNDYEAGETPDAEKVEEARLALMEILARWENRLRYHFSTRFRTRVFEASSVVLEDSVYYKCIKGFTSFDATTWQASTTYSAGDYVIPTTANGYVYKCTTAGTSNSTEPTFPAYQGRSVTDSTVVWEAVPDNKPGEGKDWTTYFIVDASQTSGDSWSYNTEYNCAGDFELLSDEYDILSGFVRYQEDDTELERESYNRLREYIDYTDEGLPTKFAIENTGQYSKVCHLRQIPQYTGDSGYILHYEARIRNLKYDSSDDTIELPDVIYSALIYQLMADIADESQIEDVKIQRWENKAERLLIEALDNLNQQDTAGYIDPCY